MTTIILNPSTLLPDLLSGTPRGWQETRLPVQDRRLPAAMLSMLKDKGFEVKFFTPQEERFKAGPGMCSYPLTPNGKAIASRTLKLSRECGSLDAIRVVSHELAHALTLTDEELLSLIAGKRSQGELMDDPAYHWGEVVAETVAYLVCSQLVPEHESLLRKGAVSYLLSYPKGLDQNLFKGNAPYVIGMAASHILNYVSTKLALDVQYGYKV